MAAAFAGKTFAETLAGHLTDAAGVNRQTDEEAEEGEGNDNRGMNLRPVEALQRSLVLEELVADDITTGGQTEEE